MPFIPHTEQDVQEMLETIGVSSIEDLFDEIPPQLRAGELTQVPEALSEMDMMRRMRERAAQDDGALCFIGAGAYEHHIPAAVWDVATRGEFMTAYTPYQAEASQGTLQLIYEYQSMMATLMAMDVSNASLYDGASGLAEAVLMAVRANRKSKSRKILVPGTVHPSYRSALEAIVEAQNIEIVEVEWDQQSGTTLLDALGPFTGEDITGMVIAQPNFFGQLEDVNALTDWAHAQKALVIGLVNPMAMAVLEAPGNWGEKGADIAVGDGQPLGVPMASGGPYYGFMCCTSAIVRQMPGRLIGRTVDLDGKPGYALTLQAREQHIRRSKATSNICTNQGLAVTASTIYMSMQGPDGLANTAGACYQNTQALVEKLTSIEGVEKAFSGHNFHEVALTLPAKASAVLEKLAEREVLGGFDLGLSYSSLENTVLVCVTETKTDSDLEVYKLALADVLTELNG
ncbi:aminomethyl-transferring glycine dehydrogenase subunit GcvPA [Litoribacillus peritrichatus]|uniref:Probable glycine dehydrogenase (decarboxylating) subunit 1 n=1 Tax=Litoribacillus peritrichatus TaxID=718191 RepID=A0ABP7NHB4_9GAMM